MLNIAVKSLKADFFQGLRGKNAILFLIFICLAVLCPVIEKFTALLCLSSVWVLVMERYFPNCPRIYYLLPLNEKQRKQIIIYKNLIIECVIIVYAFIMFVATRRIEALGAAGIFLAVYFSFSTMMFASYAKNKSHAEVGVSVLVFIIAWVGIIIVWLLSDIVSMNIWFGINAVPYCVMSVNKWYFIRRMELKEYSYIESLSGEKGE